MSRSYRQYVPCFVDKAGRKKGLKKSTHKAIRTRIRNALRKEKFELLYDKFVGKKLPADYRMMDYDIYTSKEDLERFGLSKKEINKMISK